ncbi:MAG: penicillin-binding protein [Dysgonamonadaceae bacterium]|jgi:cell division protein FtsI (penicillin-binding protein 3)|nr:penicillin-binding protein [Dysgonamonadaceae bacterium]
MPEKGINAQKMMTCYFIIAVLMVVTGILIFGKANMTSWKDGERWRSLGAKQENDTASIPSVRGDIYACGGELLATNEDRYLPRIDFWAQAETADSLKCYLPQLRDSLYKVFSDSLANRLIDRLQQGLKWKAEQDLIRKHNPKFQPNRSYPLRGVMLDFIQLQTLQSMPFFKKGKNASGLGVETRRRRVNPYGSLAWRTIGDVYATDSIGTDKKRKTGKNGLEMEYDSLLSGQAGWGVKRKVNGRSMVVPFLQPVPGKDIITTIDVQIQDIVEKNLKKKLQELDAESGTAVLMETATGEVKAITNMGRIREGVWSESRNFAVSDMSAPGSTFKMISMMVMLEDGVVSPDDPVDVGNGVYNLFGNRIEDHNANRGGYGQITAFKSIQYSSNIGVGKLVAKAYGSNPSRYVDGIYRIGFHQDMHLEIPGYAVPYIPHPKEQGRYWAGTDLFTMSYGYVTQIPPVYTLSFYNAIANNGRLVKPVFVRDIKEGNKIVEHKKPVVINRQICSPEVLTVIHQMLDSVVNGANGTGKPALSKLVRIAGKTGTAQLQDGSGGHQVSFCGYFPADAPEYSMIVVVRRPRNGNPSGGLMCGTVFKAVAEEIFTRNIISDSRALPSDTVAKEAVLKKRLADLNPEVQGLPNVVGMGAKDAVYAVERAGFRVRLGSGRGKVVSQSLLPGNIVFLQLK